MKKIGKFEMIDHEIEHSQHFQGCGIALTSFEYVVTGIGGNLAEATDDCLEQVAQNGFETEYMEARILKQESLDSFPTTPVAEGDEIFYRVSIRWNDDDSKDCTDSTDSTDDKTS